MVWQPNEYQQIEQEEHASRLRLETAREQAAMIDGELPSEHHELIHKLEAEWKQALERLHRVRPGTQD